MFPESILAWRWFVYWDYLVVFWVCEHGRPHLVVVDMYPTHVAAGKIRRR